MRLYQVSVYGIAVVCCRCTDTMAATAQAERDGYAVSHGYCPSCYEDMQAEIADFQYKAEAEACRV